MKLWLVGFGLLTAVQFGGSDVIAASSCEQTFSVLVKTRGDHSLLIYKEAVGGGCIFTDLHILFLEQDTIWTFKTRFTEAYDPVRLPHFRDMDREEEVIPVMNDGVLLLNDTMSIGPPPYDSGFGPRFVECPGGPCGVPRLWYKHCTAGCLDQPVIDFPAELIYHNQRGVYKNYLIKTAWYWEESGYLLIQTDNPNKATGLDTMHGMLLYRVGSKD